MHSELTSPTFIAAVVVVILIVVAAVALYTRKRRKNTAGLRDRFVPEYDKAVLTHGSERKAEVKLAGSETRVESLKIRELRATQRERYIVDWQAVQSRFVDHPKGAVTEADEFITALLRDRGYPVADFDQRAADISVNHPRLVEYYRSAHGVAMRMGRDEASTEDLRAAMIQYRSLFDELVQVQPPAIVRSVGKRVLRLEVKED